MRGGVDIMKKKDEELTKKNSELAKKDIEVKPEMQGSERNGFCSGKLSVFRKGTAFRSGTKRERE